MAKTTTKPKKEVSVENNISKLKSVDFPEREGSRKSGYRVVKQWSVERDGTRLCSHTKASWCHEERDNDLY
jgi:hypothetical protein